MPFDAFFLSAVVKELNACLPDARIDKIQQPERESVLLSLRTALGSRKLLLCASSNHPRIHFTNATYDNPAQPPMFCMLLRKHLSNGRIRSLRQFPLERAVELTVDCNDELGMPSEKHLILELMGRNSNLIFTSEDGHILDCLRRVDFEMSELRQVLPGLLYRLPPPQNKLNPLTEDEATVYNRLSSVSGQKHLSEWLNETYLGLSPLLARELAVLSAGDTEADIAAMDEHQKAQTASVLLREFSLLRAQDYHPTLLRKNGEEKDFSFRTICQYGSTLQCESYDSFSALLDAFFTRRALKERMRQRSQTMHKTVSNLYARVTRKLEVQRRELSTACDRERLRQLGDIVTANLHRITKGQGQLLAEDFYDPDMKEIAISLHRALSPQQNAAKFYKDYARAKTAERVLTEQLATGEAEQAYLSSILEELSRAETETDLTDIRAELLQEGYLHDTDKRKKMKQQPSRPMEFVSSDGYTVYVGRNNRQNDFLTCKAAYKSDIWLHTQKIHGSHVIIACGGEAPPDRTVTEAAMLAAYYSQARLGQNVPVDYCPVRQVHKAAGAKPGMVLYDNYKTCYVTPDAALPEQLAARKGDNT